MKFVVAPNRCVGCLACARVCPTGAIAVPAEETATVSIVDDSCIRCGICLPACPHDAIDALGNLQVAESLLAEGRSVLILGTEAPAHFYPATPEQVINACYAAGFQVVSRGVLGDELVAAEYMRLWEEEGWGTMIRSTDPVVVGAVCMDYPQLIPYLAPISTPPVAEARYLKWLGGAGFRVVYAGSWPIMSGGDVEATITFEDLRQLFRSRGVDVMAQPTFFSRVPMERRRHISLAGGVPAPWLTRTREDIPKGLRIRGLEGLKALARAVTAQGKVDLGFVDILSVEGALDLPISGPREDLLWRRAVVQTSEPPRSPEPIVDPAGRFSIGATFEPRQPKGGVADPAKVEETLALIGTEPSGKAWDCGVCGYRTCREFAEVVALGRTSLRLCPPYLARIAATDVLTGLATRRILTERLAQERERSNRSGDRFALLFLDLDRLKLINDRFGHEAGDQVIRAVADEIKSAVRATDLAARYAGDEFVVLLPRTDGPGALRVAEALRSGVERVGQRLGYEPGSVTVSIGITEYDPAAPPAADLLQDADSAMYRAKALGRNKVVQLR